MIMMDLIELLYGIRILTLYLGICLSIYLSNYLGDDYDGFDRTSVWNQNINSLSRSPSPLSHRKYGCHMIGNNKRDSILE